MDTEIFKNKKLMPILALICALLWALAYPFIKLGYKELGIMPDDLGSKIVFAGIRFLSAGLLVLILFGRKKVIKNNIKIKTWGWLILFSLINTFFHYLFAYIGLGYIPSSRGTILDSTGSFFLIILSCAIFADDTMSFQKAIGCILGFSGILFINLEPGKPLFENITFLGDGMIILNAICAAFGGILSRVVSKKTDITFATGISMAIGGFILCIVGFLVYPEKMWNISLLGITMIIALILISAISFSIYNSLLVYHPISKVAIFNAFIPIFGVIFSSILLKESFNWKYLAAGIMTAVGTYFANYTRKKDKI